MTANSLTQFKVVTGQVVLSEDACGTNAPSCTVQIVKPSPMATVAEADLFCATTGLSNYHPNDGEVTLNGALVKWDQIIPSAIQSFNARDDVTSIVKPVADAALPGTVTFTITENPTLKYDGCILKVIWNDPTTTQNSILIYFGAQQTTGDTLVVNFAQPLSASAFAAPLEFSLGISFGLQPSFPSQFSQVDVNGMRLTTSAGGEDDGTFNQNGALITVGGTGDSSANPLPFAAPVTATVPDDELYDLRPFVNVGDTSMTIFTLNPSNDDNIFIANLFLRNVTVVTAALVLTPPAATNPVGTQHCVTATATAANGDPTPNVTVIFSVTGANPRPNTSGTTDANGQTTFCYTGTVAGSDVISAFADTNNNGSFDPGEARGEALKEWLAGPPATLVLTPPTATNTVGDQHCVTATVADVFANPTPGITVRFTVIGAAATFSTPSSGSATTNGAGQATFCFTAALPGVNGIHAFADTNNSGSQDPGEPFGDAEKTWILPVGTALCEIKVTDGGHITAINADSASFGGVARSDDAGNASGNEEYQDHGPAMPMNVKATEILAITCTPDFKTATVYGTATIDGSGSYAFRIRMTDNNEPGKGYDVYGILLSNGYNSGDKVLDGGNIQIHKL
ncbi:MAG TPA: post-COAP-1 domain-containing protein [Candidatus Limnocylindria bacterium]